MVSSSPIRIVFLGAPGAGKGTQAKKIGQTLGLPVLSTGDLFRTEIKNQTLLGKEVKSILDQGLLVSDDIVFRMIRGFIESPECSKGYILDGFPRTLLQASSFAGLFGQPEFVIFFDVGDELILKRTSGRFSCATCGEIFNKFFKPLKNEGECDNCQGNQFKFREDDREEVVLNRLKVYHKDTASLIGYYRDMGRLVTVNGEGSSAEVTDKLLKIIRL